ncbi:EAL domain-containing protein [Allohahella sp. A8]|uniref:EAL domain-containing protein n=1 Tax=Allohahella sp. A8 TaxID=3141461 RepID=UPI003A808051
MCAPEPAGRVRLTRRIKFAWATVLFIMLSAAVQSVHAESPALDIALHQDKTLLNPVLSYTLDAGSATSPTGLSELQPEWLPAGEDIINFGFESRTLWLRLRLYNSNTVATTRFISIEHPILNEVDYFRVDPTGKIVEEVHTGDQRPFSSRPIESRHFVFPVTVKAGSAAWIYFRIKSDSSLQAPVWLSSPTEFYAHAQLDIVQHTMYAGVMLAMVLYNMFLLMSLRERVYFYYVMFVFSSLLAQVCLTGLWSGFVAPGATGLQDTLLRISVPALPLFSCLFARHFLRLKVTAPRFDILFLVAAIASAAVLLAGFFVSYKITILAAILLILLTSASCLTVGPYLWIKGNTMARFYTLAWAGVMIAVFVFMLTRFNIIPRTFLTENSPPIGSALEAILLSFALADRLNQERRRRYESQKALLTETQHRRAAEASLYRQALYHHRLQIPNRAFLETWFQRNVSADSKLMICLLHFSRFHEVNKTLGHGKADQMLLALCERLDARAANLSGVVRLDSLDVADRPGQGIANFICSVEGATFAILIQPPARFMNADTPSTDETLLDSDSAFVTNTLGELGQLVSEFAEPFESGELVVELGAVAGVAACPVHADRMEPLLQKAQIAVDASSRMNHALTLFSEEINPYNERRLSLAGDLRKAIADNTLTLAFQPKITASSSKIDSIEALLRWHHPQHGFIGPDEFIPVAEQTGIIHWLTDWVLKTALQSLAVLHGQGFDLKVAVNISAVNLRERDFAARLAKALAEHDMPASCLILEVTESAMMIDPERACEVLDELHDMGVSLSIDDFGTGYSSLSYIKRLPVQEIKLDRSFVMELDGSNDDRVIVETTIRMAHALDLKIVAEGVETKTAFELLASMGCDVLQGYYMSRPIPLADLSTLLTTSRGHFQHKPSGPSSVG